MITLVENLFDGDKSKRTKITLATILSILTLQFFLPNPSHVAMAQVLDQDLRAGFLKDEFAHALPQAADVPLELVRTVSITVTSYNSEPGQTDNTPCITANGFDLCKHGIENVIATNYLPFGTKVKFPEIDAERIYTVQDRMNARYYKRADIWMKNKADSRTFGIKNLTMEIYK